MQLGGSDMRRVGILVFNMLAVALSALPGAADGIPARCADLPALFDWRGLYVGYHSGGVLGLADVDDPYGPSIFGEPCARPACSPAARSATTGCSGARCLGLEADASWADTDGTNTCLAFSGFYVGSNCHTHIDALGTLTARIGWALGDDGRTLLYAKGGAAWVHGETDVRVNGGLGYPGTQRGWPAVGLHTRRRRRAGAERALVAHGPSTISSASTAPASRRRSSGFQAVPDAIGTLVNVAGAASDVSLDLHVLKLGVNYRLGDGAPLLDPDFGLGTLRAPRPRAGSSRPAPATSTVGPLPEGPRHPGPGAVLARLAADV